MVLPGRLRAEPLLHLSPPRPEGPEDGHLLPRRGQGTTGPPGAIGRARRGRRRPLVPLGHLRADQAASSTHAKIRQVFAEADAWLKGGHEGPPAMTGRPATERGFLRSASTAPTAAARRPRPARLVEWLPGARGGRSSPCRDPGGTPLGERLRSILLDRSGRRALPPGRDVPLHDEPGPARRGGDPARPRIPAKSSSPIATCWRNVRLSGVCRGLPVESIWEVGRRRRPGG